MDQTLLPIIDWLKEVIRQSIREELNQSPTKKQDNDDELLKVIDVKKLFDVSTVTIYHWRKKGILPYYRISNKIYFKKSEVIGLLSSLKIKGRNR